MLQHPPGLHFAAIRKPEDFLLVSYDRGTWTSPWFPQGTGANSSDDFFRELYLEATLSLPTLWPVQDIVLLEGIHGDGGWRLVWSQHGYLQLVNRADNQRIATSRLPLATFVEPLCRIGLLLSNLAYGRPCRGDLADTIQYSQITLYAAKSPQLPLRPLFNRTCDQPHLPPVPRQWRIPPENPLLAFTAWNTVRRELWQLPNDPGGPAIDTDFSGASRVFGRYDAAGNTLHLLTGPEFLRTDSYWLFTRIRQAIAGRTRLRLHLSKYHAMPNMAPVFFWSPDRQHWHPAPLLEASTEAGAFQPLLPAPADDFYLASSLPFMDLERQNLCRQAASLPYVRQEAIGHSVAGNPIVMLTATDPAVPDHDKHDVLIIIGQHSPQEMIGAHAIMPLFAELARRPGLLQKMALHVIPTVNVDAAAYGSDGLNLNLYNTNRCWFEDEQPEVKAVIDWCRRQPRRFLLFFDWHAGGTWRNHTILWFNRDVRQTHAPDHVGQLDKRQAFVLERLGHHCGIRPEDGIEHPFRQCCATDWFQTQFPACLPLTIEFSTCSHFDPTLGRSRPVTLDSLHQLGRRFALFLDDLLASNL